MAAFVAKDTPMYIRVGGAFPGASQGGRPSSPRRSWSAARPGAADGCALEGDRFMRQPHGRPSAEDDAPTPTEAVDGGAPEEALTGGPAVVGLSAGSGAHAVGLCRPCFYVRTPAGCKFGADCGFCHILADHPRLQSLRPCKEKRIRLHRTIEAIERRIAKNPGAVTSGSLDLPSAIAGNPYARDRLLARLAKSVSEAEELRMAGSSLR